MQEFTCGSLRHKVGTQQRNAGQSNSIIPVVYPCPEGEDSCGSKELSQLQKWLSERIPELAAMLDQSSNRCSRFQNFFTRNIFQLFFFILRSSFLSAATFVVVPIFASLLLRLQFISFHETLIALAQMTFAGIVGRMTSNLRKKNPRNNHEMQSSAGF